MFIWHKIQNKKLYGVRNNKAIKIPHKNIQYKSQY